MSKFVRPGLVRMLRPELPNVNPVGAENAAGLNIKGPAPSMGTLPTWALGFPTSSGNEPALATPFPTPALSEGIEPAPALNTLNGVPLWMLVIPDHSHPPKIL